MSMRIKTKWGQINIEPERIFGIDVTINPWMNIYRITFVIENSYERIAAEMDSISELMTAMNRIENELTFVKQYKRVDPSSGQLVIDEPRRLAAMRERK